MPIDSSGNYWIARDSSGTYSADYYMALARNNASTIASYNNTVNSLVTAVSQPINGAVAYYPKLASDPAPFEGSPVEHSPSTIDAINFLFYDGMNDFVNSTTRFTNVFSSANVNFNVINLNSALSNFLDDYSGNLVYSPYYLYQGTGAGFQGAVGNSVFQADALALSRALFNQENANGASGEYDADIQNFMDNAKAMKVAFDTLKDSLEAEPTTETPMSDPLNGPATYYSGFKDITLKNYYIFLHNLLNNTLSFDSSNNLLYNTLSFDSADNPIYTPVIDSSNNPLPVLDSSNNRIPVPGFPGTYRTYTNIYNRLRFDSSNNIIIPAFPSTTIEDLVNSVGTAIEINHYDDGSFEFWDGVYMIESHTWCNMLNKNKDYPSFSLVNQKFNSIEELKDFIIDLY